MATLGPRSVSDIEGAGEYFKLIEEHARKTGKNPKDFCPWEFSVITKDGEVHKFHSAEAALFGISRFGAVSLSVFPGSIGEYNGLRPEITEGQGTIVNIVGHDKNGKLHLLLVKEMRQSIDGSGLEGLPVTPVLDSVGRYSHYQVWQPPMGFSAHDPNAVATKMLSITDTVLAETGEETGLTADSFTLLYVNPVPINMNSSCVSSHNSHVAFVKINHLIEDFVLKPKEGELITGFKWFSVRELHELNSIGHYDNALLRSGPPMGAVSMFISEVAVGNIK